MKGDVILRHEFVDHVPEVLREGTVYISIKFATATHKCCCGCGNEVVTPISPTGWTLIFDGETISLDPSIGNWSFPCQSHYWIRRNRVKWAPAWSRERIAAGRAYEAMEKERFLGSASSEPAKGTEVAKKETEAEPSARGFWQRVWKFLSRR
jgi:hypothetical protein